MHRRLFGPLLLTFALGIGFAACGTGRDAVPDDGKEDSGRTAGGDFVPLDDAGLPIGMTRDPVDCNEARTSKSYVGCDYWPTVTANNVWSDFDFAVVVANTGAADANVTVEGPNGFRREITVSSGELREMTLPWVKELKGPDADSCGRAAPLGASVVARGGAYHLVSSSPVIVYQFNALEYEGKGGTAADGTAKDWSRCPGSTKLCDPPLPPATQPYYAGCFSFTNDASLLLPSTALTGNYRIIGQHGWTDKDEQGRRVSVLGPTLSITATADATEVTVRLSPYARVLAGGGIPASKGGTTFKLTLNKGDVAELAGEAGDEVDMSGSLVVANKPVQVISAIPCILHPDGIPACDHIEETVFPAETFGKHYIVTKPSGPNGPAVGHIVRFFGNVDGTALTYNPSQPPGCPSALSAGQVSDCAIVETDFEVMGSHEFAVGSFTLGAHAIDPRPAQNPDYRPKGDPDESFFASAEQFRTEYLFLAPNDYDVAYVDIAGTRDAAPVLDGQMVTAFEAIGAGPFGVYRVKLGPGKAGAHRLTSAKPVGIQVMGYGAYTSYQYPGGLNLQLISAPPSLQ